MYEESRPAVAENCTSGSPRFYQPRDANPAVLAMHWHLAGEREQAALASLAAAEQAEQMHAPAATRVQYERILAAWPRLRDSIRQRCGPRAPVLRRTAYAAERSGDFARAVDLTAERIAAAEGTAADQALRWERLARYRWEAEDGHGSRAAYEEAVRVSAEQRACRRTSHGPLRLRLAPRGNVPL